MARLVATSGGSISVRAYTRVGRRGLMRVRSYQRRGGDVSNYAREQKVLSLVRKFEKKGKRFLPYPWNAPRWGSSSDVALDRLIGKKKVRFIRGRTRPGGYVTRKG